jgi:leucyl aminopeptidase
MTATTTSSCTFESALGERAPLVLLVDRRWAANAVVRDLDRRGKGILVKEAKRRKFQGVPDQEVTVQTHGAISPPSITLVGCPPDSQFRQLFATGDRIAAIAKRESTVRIAVVPPADIPPAWLRVVAEGAALARYRFREYQSGTVPREALTIRFVTAISKRVAGTALREAAIRASAVSLARDLANTPAGALPPTELAARAAALAGGDLSVQVHDVDGLTRLGMGAILAVGQGSRNPPRLIELVYEPESAPAGHVALVGKGITFDSGGLSLKPANAMELMKRDMAGGATVIASMQAVAALGLPIRVRGYVPTAENMPDGNAIRPGDVVTAFNGKTIEVLNTDAEGRLVLADALAYAVTFAPHAVVDFATLTGAVRVALGRRYAAIMGNDQRLVARCLEAAAAAGEGLWQLPLVEDYRPDIASQIADIKNTGTEGAGTILAGLFLREFVGATPWAHIDFSSTVMSDGYPGHPAGPSGYGVRTALEFLQQRASNADATQAE